MFVPAALLAPLQHLPGVCQVCGAWPARPVCDDCGRRHGACVPRCPRCARRVNREGDICAPCRPGTGTGTGTGTVPPGPTRLVAAVDYGYPWDDLIARFKFRNEPAWSHAFAGLLWRDAQARDLVSGCDVLVPIPITARRLEQRGYNQAWELVKALRRLQRPARPALADALLRMGDAPDQHALPREQRLQNLRGSFMVHPQHIERLRAARVLLVDDVSTTGTTLQRAAQALLQAGAAEVHALVVARTAEH